MSLFVKMVEFVKINKAPTFVNAQMMFMEHFAKKVNLITARKRSLGQCHVFTGVCLSTGWVCLGGSVQGGLPAGV